MLAYYLIISGITFLVWGMDKYRAKAQLWRISERWLITLTLLGGAFGALTGMLFFRHKTRKTRFWVIVVLGCLLHTYIFITFGR